MSSLRTERTLEPDRTIGWIVALSGALLLLGRLPTMLDQRASFALGWWVLALLLLGFIVVLALLGRILPAALLRASWIAIPLLGIVVSFTWAPAYLGGVLAADATFDPWIRGMEAGIVAYPLLWARLPGAIGFGAAFPFVSLLSPWVFWGSVPQAIFADIPIHVGMVAFVIIFAGIRARLQMIGAEERNVDVQREQEWHAEERLARQQELGRLVHDEVLSALVGAMHASGVPSVELRREAAAALAALDDAERFGRLPETIPARQGIDALVDAVAEFERAEVRLDLRSHRLPSVPGQAIDALSMAMREAVRNATKYAESGTISVVVAPGESRWVVTVDDTGPGFEFDQVPTDRLGVRESLIGRMRGVGGDVSIRSRAPEGRGTSVELLWPR